MKATGLKLAELLSTAGAAILGAGLALLYAATLTTHAKLIVAAGVAAHAAGMLLRQHLEQAAGVQQPAWMGWVYRICWLGLVALVLLLL